MAASKLALFLALNLALLAATAHGCGSYCSNPIPPIVVPPPAPVPPTPSTGCGSYCSNPTPVPTPPIAVPPPAPVPRTPPTGCGSYCSTPTPVPVPTPPIVVPPPAPVPPTPSTGCGSYCPHPTPVPTPPIGGGTCPIDTLKLSVCANVLNLLKLNLGAPSTGQCCRLLSGLADLDAAICLCTAIKANVLGISLNVQVDLVLLLNQCGKTCPDDFTCAV